jgi:phosphate transport system protein
MLRELINLFRTSDPLGEMGAEFSRMLNLTAEMMITAGAVFLDGGSNPEVRSELYKSDAQVNAYERSIRKRVVAHLALPNRQDVAYCLALMSLVKDVERLGDYAKNVAEIPDIQHEPLPDDELKLELMEIRRATDSLFAATIEIFNESDNERAVDQIQQGRNLMRRCEAMIQRIARSEHDAGTTTALVLGARFYKRIAAHLVNVLTAVVMPLHKLDYYDERELQLPGAT